jgi:spore germination protein
VPVVEIPVPSATGPEGGGWARGHDYQLLGRYSHELHVMAYDLHTESSEPGPVAPLWWVNEVLRYATSVVPSQKVVLGIGLFGYDWDAPRHAEGVTPKEAEARVRRYEGELTFDERAQSPVFTYGVDGIEHELWFEDPRSIRRKLEYVDTYDLGGAFFWRMGDTTPAVWDVVEDTLEVRS